MGLIEPTTYNSAMPSETINGEQEVLNMVKKAGSGKAQLKKAATEFEAVFISKMFSTMDQTVDKEGGIFGEETKYVDAFKSYMYNQVGREMASNPRTSFGFAKQIYEQMEKQVKD
jgi:Rod binding domain-containing protein